ncbi:DUF11 domain-containing protein [Actinomadura flavalba]|uniref:DUF11 domain-containing protein n=1 Tax=Actinomadura flavalba TaxID=1120938 RepID=UPI0004765A84|nr:DUF11 domain-containing protein [Actinomadura flavalba]
MRLSRRRGGSASAAMFALTALTVTCTPAAAAVLPADGPPTPPRLQLTKSTSTPKVKPGGKATFKLTLRNVGMVPASNVRLRDPAPAGLTIASVAGSGCAKAGNAVTCRWKTVPYKATRTITVNAKVTQGAEPGKLTNVATLSYAGRTATARAAVTVQAAAAAKPQSAVAHAALGPRSAPKPEPTTSPKPKPAAAAEQPAAGAAPGPAATPNPLRPCVEGETPVRDSSGRQSCVCAHQSASSGGSGAPGAGTPGPVGGPCRKATAGELPNTGSPIGWLSGLGLGAFALGGIALIITRRRARR